MIPQRLPAVVHELAETGETILCDVDGARLLVLNDVGAAVWYLIDGRRSVDEIVSLVVSTLDADRAVVTRDVAAFLAELETQGLIEPRA